VYSSDYAGFQDAAVNTALELRERLASGVHATLGLAALVTTLIAGRIGTPDQVLLMLPWFAWFGVWGQTGQRIWIILSVLIVLLLPWTVFFSLLQGNQEAIVVTTILPLFTLTVFLVVTLVSLRTRRAA